MFSKSLYGLDVSFPLSRETAHNTVQSTSKLAYIPFYFIDFFFLCCHFWILTHFIYYVFQVFHDREEHSFTFEFLHNYTFGGTYLIHIHFRWSIFFTYANRFWFVPGGFAVCPHHTGEDGFSLQRIAAITVVSDRGTKLQLCTNSSAIPDKTWFEARLSGVLCLRNKMGKTLRKCKKKEKH